MISICEIWSYLVESAASCMEKIEKGKRIKDNTYLFFGWLTWCAAGLGRLGPCNGMPGMNSAARWSVGSNILSHELIMVISERRAKALAEEIRYEGSQNMMLERISHRLAAIKLIGRDGVVFDGVF